MNTNTVKEPIILGKVAGHFGVHGWLKTRSYTRPFDQICQYDNLLVRAVNQQEVWVGVKVINFRRTHKNIVVKIDGYDCREESQSLIGGEIGIAQSELELLPTGEYYWKDLIGLRATNLDTVDLGEVVDLMETGANDVLVVRSKTDSGDLIERLIPWIPSVIRSVDLENRVISADWSESW